MTTIKYDELSSNLSDVALLDVRNETEVQENGRIPGSHSIPYSELSSALQMDSSDFESKYGFEKPSHDDTLVTYCSNGVKAMRAHDTLRAHGYNNVKCYSGSFSDWVQNGGTVEK